MRCWVTCEAAWCGRALSGNGPVLAFCEAVVSGYFREHLNKAARGWLQTLVSAIFACCAELFLRLLGQDRNWSRIGLGAAKNK